MNRLRQVVAWMFWPRGVLALLTLLSASGCQPQLDSDSPKARLKAVGWATNAIALAKVVREDPVAGVRLMAVRRLKQVGADPHARVFEEAALHDASAQIRLEALPRLTNEAVLARIALSDKTPEVRRAAIRRIQDPSSLAEIMAGDLVLSREADARFRLRAVGGLNDQELLERLVIEEKDDAVRFAALARITDQPFLIQAFLQATNQRMRELAASNIVIRPIADEAVYVRIAKRSSGIGVSEAAFQKVTNPATIAQFAAGKHPSLAIEALHRISDPRVLTRLAVEDRVLNVRFSSTFRTGEVDLQALLGSRIRRFVTNQALLEQIATGSNATYRHCAILALTNQDLLASLAGNGSEAAALQLTDQALLAGLVTNRASGVWVQRAAAVKLRDPRQIEALAVDHPDRNVRLALKARLRTLAMTNQVELELAARKNDRDLIASAVQRLTSPDVLREVLESAQLYSIKTLASQRLRELVPNDREKPPPAEPPRPDPSATGDAPSLLLAAIDSNRYFPARNFRTIALLNAHFPELCLHLAKHEKNEVLREVAMLLLHDQSFVESMAVESPNAVTRQMALRAIASEAFLLARARRDSSEAVRNTAISLLEDRELLREAASSAYHAHVRAAALKQLENSPQTAAAQAVQQQIEARVRALGEETDPRRLAATAISGGTDVECLAAAQRLSDPVGLEEVALKAPDRAVLRAVLGKMAATEALTRVAQTTTNAMIRLAFSRKAGRLTWSDVFKAAEKSSPAMGDALAALSLSESPQGEAADAAQAACLTLIRRGDESRIPEMAELLEGYGDKRLAEDYLNCGQPDLNSAASFWARSRGLRVNQGAGSHRATWGSSRN